MVGKLEGQPDNWLEIAEKSQPFGRLLKPKDAAGALLKVAETFP